MIKSLNLFIQAARYEQWLEQQEANINNQLKYYETEIAKLRKQKKVGLFILLLKFTLLPSLLIIV